MKKKILLVILAVIIASAAVFAYVQRANISALIDGIRYDDEVLDKQVRASEENVNKYLEDNNLATVKTLTPEEESALLNGEISEKDAVKIITGSMTLEQAKQSASSETESEGSGKPAEANGDGANNQGGSQQEPVENQEDSQGGDKIDYDTLISEKVARLYVVKANFNAQLNSMHSAAIAEYDSLPAAQHTDDMKIAIIKSKIGAASALEKQCDAQVNTIISELTELLKNAGRDTSLASTIKSAYEQEKKALKAKWINRYF